jgi:hypothetical protein
MGRRTQRRMSRKNFFVVEYCGVWKKRNCFVSGRILGFCGSSALGFVVTDSGLGSHPAISVGSEEQKS